MKRLQRTLLDGDSSCSLVTSEENERSLKKKKISPIGKSCRIIRAAQNVKCLVLFFKRRLSWKETEALGSDADGWADFFQ